MKDDVTNPFVYPQSKPLFMTEKDGNGETILVPGSEKILNGGLTLRDHFATAALIGILYHTMSVREGGVVADTDVAAKIAYLQADAMIKARRL